MVVFGIFYIVIIYVMFKYWLLTYRQENMIIMKDYILFRLVTKLELALSRSPLDLDFLEFTCRQELYLWEALSRHVYIQPELVKALKDFFILVKDYSENGEGNIGSTETQRG